MDHSNPRPLSIPQAIGLLRSADLTALDQSKLEALRVSVTERPSIIEFDGCEDGLFRIDAELERRRIPAGATDPSGLRRSRPIGLVTALGLVAIAAVVWIALRETAPQDVSPLVARQSPAPPADVIESPAGPPVRMPVPSDAASSTAAEPVPVLDVDAVAEVAEDRPPLPEPPAEAQPKLAVTGAGARLDADPAGGFRLSEINGTDFIGVSGPVSRLVLADINGEPTLELLDLSADQFEFRGSINGNPRVSLRAPGAEVEFHREVGGSTVLEIDAPGGTVTFHAPVAGGVRLEIVARSVIFKAGLDGGAAADVTLTSGGSLHYTRLNGGSSLTHRRTDGDQPASAITGDTSGSGSLIEGVPRSQ
jgi:hypothetical protein